MKEDLHDVYSKMTKDNRSQEPPWRMGILKPRWRESLTRESMWSNPMHLIPGMNDVMSTPEDQHQKWVETMALNIENYVNPDMLEMCSPQKVSELKELFLSDIKKKPQKSKQQIQDEKKAEMEKQVMDFEDYGGLSWALREMYKPNKDTYQDDPVYGLKKHARQFYHQKNSLAHHLVDTLDTMAS